MQQAVFEFDSYKNFINKVITTSPMKGRGIKLKIANEIGVQPAFVSRVLNGDAHFSFEQMNRISKIFELAPDEARFLRLLLHFERAGSHDLKETLRQEIKEIQVERLKIVNRIDIKNRLADVDQQVYYSNWIYAAIHMMITIPKFRVASNIAKELNLSLEKVIEVLQFLVKTGLAKKVESHYEVGLTRLHVPKDSPQVIRHHTNWRIQAMEAIGFNLDENIHYTNLVSMSVADVPRVREELLKAIENCRKIIKESPEEGLQCLTIDFFCV